MSPAITALTMSNHWSSPCGTTGVSGSSEMISGSMTWSSGFVSSDSSDASPDLSVVKASHCPALYASKATSVWSKIVGV